VTVRLEIVKCCDGEIGHVDVIVKKEIVMSSHGKIGT
jgi:hypothetical protein